MIYTHIWWYLHEYQVGTPDPPDYIVHNIKKMYRLTTNTFCIWNFKSSYIYLSFNLFNVVKLFIISM
jgi:predicted SAM-dependent methyltransferase